MQSQLISSTAFVRADFTIRFKEQKRIYLTLNFLKNFLSIIFAIIYIFLMQFMEGTLRDKMNMCRFRLQ